MSNGMGNTVVYSLVNIGNYIFAGNKTNPVSSGVYYSTNNGLNWYQTSLNNKDVWSLTVNGNDLYAGTWVNGVYRSTNLGLNWIQTSLGNGYDVSALASSGNYIFAGTDYHGILITTNNGLNWTQSFLRNQWVLSLSAYENYIYTGISDSGIYLSPDYGVNWYHNPSNFRYIWTFAYNGNDVFAGVNQSGVYKSTNNGFDWFPTSLNNKIVYSIAIYDSSIFAGTFLNGIFVSNDYGINWRTESAGYATGRIPKTMCIFNNYVFIGTDGSGVYRRPLSELTAIKAVSNEIPNGFMLYQNYPNPFNPNTKIRFALPPSPKGEELGVRVIIYDIFGREAATLVNEQLQPGTYEVEWSATGGTAKYSSGVYFYKITAGKYSETKKMILLK